MVKVAIATLGCKVNQYESAGMVEDLRKEGFAPCSFTGAADVFIINTCAVTGKADYQSRQLIRRALRSNPLAKIIVTGCYAQTAPREISSMEGVSAVVGNGKKEDMPQVVRAVLEDRGGVDVGCIMETRAFSAPAVMEFPGRTRAFLKIQDGCNAFCSYCIVPYARGGSRSLPPEQAMDRLMSLNRAGYREVVLTGIHLGAYGQDLLPTTDLSAFLRRAERECGARLRLSSLEPREISTELIEFVKNTGGLCRHFHIPLQSGDDGILLAMGRNYNRRFFKDLIEEITEAMPDAAVGADVMVGFPGEGEKQFASTVQLIEELPLAYLHVFPYSPRPGTAAAGLPGQVGEAERRKRARIIRQLGNAKRNAFAAGFIGKELTVLLERRKDRETGLMQGFSGNYIPVSVTNARPSDINRLVSVRPETLRDGRLTGKIVDHER